MVVPVSLVSGGKALGDFRDSMLADDRLRSIDDYLDEALLTGWTRGGFVISCGTAIIPAKVPRHHTRYRNWPVSAATRRSSSGADVIIRAGEGLSILKEGHCS